MRGGGRGASVGWLVPIMVEWSARWGGALVLTLTCLQPNGRDRAREAAGADAVPQLERAVNEEGEAGAQVLQDCLHEMIGWLPW